MILNEVANLRELQLHGVINGLTRDLDAVKEKYAECKLKMDSIIERAECAERELLDREESIYKLTLKLISCEARLMARSQESADMQVLTLTERVEDQKKEIEMLQLSAANKNMRIQSLEASIGNIPAPTLKIASA